MSHGENTLLRVTPTLTHYSDIVSGISSGSIYGIYIYSDISFWPSIWHLFWHSIWHVFLTFYLACIPTFFMASILEFILASILTFDLTLYLASFPVFLSDIFSGILSDTCDILSDILPNIYSGILSGILSGIELAIGFGSRRAPLHPELAIWWSGRVREWRGEWVTEWVSERVALLKSRDPCPGRWGKHTLRGS